MVYFKATVTYVQFTGHDSLTEEGVRDVIKHDIEDSPDGADADLISIDSMQILSRDEYHEWIASTTRET